ncbi:MAG: HlyD family secretion protein [Bacteroidota bacterium]
MPRFLPNTVSQHHSKWIAFRKFNTYIFSGETKYSTIYWSSTEAPFRLGHPKPAFITIRSTKVRRRRIRKGKMKNRFLIIALTIFAAGCSSNPPSADFLKATGTIEATETSVAVLVPGQIIKMNFEEGAEVKAGDTLAEIDHKSLVQHVKQAEASLEIAKQQYNLLIKGARREDLRVAEEAVKQAEANYHLAQLNLERANKLFAERSISQSQLDDAQTRYDVAAAQYKSAQETLAKLQKFAQPEEIKARAAQVQQAEAALNLAKIALDQSYITSPISGTITQKLLEVGDFANLGTPVYTVADLKKMKMTVYVTERELARIRLGDSAHVVLDGLPDYPFQGRVVYISPTAEFTPKNVQTKEERAKLVFAVKLEVDNRSNYLKAGLPAEATIFPQ